MHLFTFWNRRFFGCRYFDFESVKAFQPFFFQCQGLHDRCGKHSFLMVSLLIAFSVENRFFYFLFFFFETPCFVCLEVGSRLWVVRQVGIIFPQFYLERRYRSPHPIVALKLSWLHVPSLPVCLILAVLSATYIMKQLRRSPRNFVPEFFMPFSLLLKKRYKPLRS